MYLAVAATFMEMRALERTLDPAVPCSRLVAGIGPMEMAHVLTLHLCRQQVLPDGVILFGVAGAYIREDGSGPDLLDLCLAEEEILADFGICLADTVEPFRAPELDACHRFRLDQTLLDRAGEALAGQGWASRRGRFLTVQCASGTTERGAMLAARYDGLCENMEGAAAARVCAAFDLPCLEIRAISNLVEDRDRGGWRLREACARAGAGAAHVLHFLAGLPQNKQV